MEKKDIKSLTREKLTAAITQMGLPKFRAGQIFSWLHQKNVKTFEEMTNLPAALRTQLSEQFYIPQLKIVRKLVSRIDGTIKYLFELPDGERVESVLMHYKHGNSLCISSQAGCRMGCKFCASTIAGFTRNLVPSELLGQIAAACEDSGQRVHSIVMMGIGEPLDNFENVLDFLNLLEDEKGFGMSHRHVSLSTCGLVDKIRELAQKKLQITLSVSLHAPNNERRDQIMPVNHRYPVEELIAACKDYTRITGRRISFEYALISGVTDTDECAYQLAKLLKGMLCHVNLIPVNEIRERDYKKSSKESIRRFAGILEKHRLTVTVRRKLGADIDAACGQLRKDSAQTGR
ncbi:MAG TPA: 23S rRNA (adenine(2503)-C(2))-methyltransferase RlmN [Firmicutes bacterium]|nr:23S rRNA (adenine(2503)-C(2))-methyltransferase RlmN [Bacillota bacterium]